MNVNLGTRCEPTPPRDGALMQLPDRPSLSDIQRLQAALALFPQQESEASHHFAPGLYARELIIPAGAVIIGKMHRHAHLAVMAYGDMTLYSTQAGRNRMQGYHLIESPAGIKRVGYAHADSCWITFHVTQERDLEALERDIIAPEDIPDLDADARALIHRMQEVTL